MNKTRALISISLILFIYSCSKGTAYTAIQNYQRVECRKLPQSQYEQCLDELDMHYNMYKSKRAELYEEKKSNESEELFKEIKSNPSVRF